MTVQAIFDSLAARLVGKKKKAETSFTALVRTVADGKEPTGAEEILAAADKSLEDLKAAVSALLKRRELARLVKNATDFTAAMAKIAQRTKVIDGELEAAQQRYRDQAEVLFREEQAITKAEQAMQQAKVELEQTAPPELAAELLGLLRRGGELDRRQRDLVECRQKCLFDARDAESKAAKGTSLAPSYAADQTRHTESAAECAKEIASLGEQIKALEVEAESIRRKMLDP